MDQQEWIELISAMEMVKQALDGIKANPALADPRGISIAITHLETSMLWVANARHEQT